MLMALRPAGDRHPRRISAPSTYGGTASAYEEAQKAPSSERVLSGSRFGFDGEALVRAEGGHVRSALPSITSPAGGAAVVQRHALCLNHRQACLSPTIHTLHCHRHRASDLGKQTTGDDCYFCISPNLENCQDESGCKKGKRNDEAVGKPREVVIN